MRKIVVLILIVLVGVGGFFAYRHREKRRQLQQSEYIELFGNVEIRRANLGFRVPGRLEEILFEEGDFVERGEVIATLDPKPYRENLAAAQAIHDRASAGMEQMENGPRPQEIEQARAQLAESKANLKLREADMERAEQLLPKKAISQGDYDVFAATRDEAEAKVKQAEETLSLLEEGYRKEEIAVARAQLAEAKANLDQAKTSLEDTSLLCPNDGIILTRVEEPGAVVQAGQTVVTLSLKDAVWVYVYVPEPDLGLVFPGMRAEIHTDTNCGKPYPGQVGYISPEAEFTPKNVETLKLRTDLVYRLRIIADAPDEGLRQGMPVTVKLMKNEQ